MVELIETTVLASEADDVLTLCFERRQKRRQRVRLDGGREAALLLPRGAALRDGDGLRSVDGFRVVVRAAAEPVSTGRTEDALELARACYHLGNRHVALQIGPGWVRYRPDHVLDGMLEGLGLRVEREEAPFEPETGAYDAAPASSGHAHDHATPSTHEHPREHATPSTHGHRHGHGLGHGHGHDDAQGQAKAAPAAPDA